MQTQERTRPFQSQETGAAPSGDVVHEDRGTRRADGTLLMSVALALTNHCAGIAAMAKSRVTTLAKCNCEAYEDGGGAYSINVLRQGMEEEIDATCEASFKTKARDESRTGVGSRRLVAVTSGWRIRSGDSRNGSGHADDAEYRAGCRDHPR